MHDTLKGKSAIITGSTSGIGLGIAQALAEQGANVVLNGFGETAMIDSLRRTLCHNYGVRVGYVGADLAHSDEVVKLIDQATAEMGQVDILVNNAGIQYTAPVQEFPVERWNAIIAINLTAVFLATRAVLPQMIGRNWGRVVNIASVHGIVASEHKVAYVAAKHGVIGVTKTVALETATTGVTCNAICPGWVLTPLVQRQIDDLAGQESLSAQAAKARLLSEKQPSREFVTPEQLGALTVFLCSDAAAEIRGAALCVDGGWTAQ